MKTLIITRSYLDEALGGPNCSKAFINALTSIYRDCALIYPEHNDKTTDLSFLANKEVRLVPCYDKRIKVRKCFDMYRGVLHRFSCFVIQFLRENKFDVIVIDHSIVASSGVIEAVRKSGSKIITLHHNVEKDYIKDNQQSVLFRYPYNYYSLKAEDKAIRYSDVNLTLTKSDYDYFVSKYPDNASTFEVMGIFEIMNRKNGAVSTETGRVFVISGSLKARQTEIAVMSFLRDYLVILNEVCPQNKVIITGRAPSQTLLDECKKHENITVIPNPEDIEDIVKLGNIYICPIYTGSGLKLRVMDALRLGLPVIAHEVSARGYETIEDKGFMVKYSDKEAFKVALKGILSMNIRHEDVVESFYSYFSLDSGRLRLNDILCRHDLR